MKRHPKVRMWFATSQEPKDAPKILPRMTWSNSLPYVHICPYFLCQVYLMGIPSQAEMFVQDLPESCHVMEISRRIMKISTKYRKV